MDLPSRLARADAAVFRPLEEGGVLLNIETGDYYELNESGRFLWEQIEAGLEPEAVVSALADRYGIELAAARADVAEFLEGLQTRRLIAP